MPKDPPSPRRYKEGSQERKSGAKIRGFRENVFSAENFISFIGPVSSLAACCETGASSVQLLRFLSGSGTDVEDRGGRGFGFCISCCTSANALHVQSPDWHVTWLPTVYRTNRSGADPFFKHFIGPII